MYIFLGLIILGLSFIIAHFLGRKRQIGFYWSLFFCVTLGIIGGLLITLFSNKSSSETPSPSKFMKALGVVIMIITLFAIFGSLPDSNYSSIQNIGKFTLQLGLFGYGLFLTLRGNGERFD